MKKKEIEKTINLIREVMNVCYDGAQMVYERGEWSAALTGKQWNELAEKLGRAVEPLEEPVKE